MTLEFNKKMKQRLAELLGGSYLGANGDPLLFSTIAIPRGGEQLTMECFGYMQGERRLGFRVQCDLDRAKKDFSEMDYPQDPRPRVDGLPELLVRRETAKDGKGKRWKLNREVQTRDPEFDDLVYVESAAPDEHIQSVLGSREIRRIIVKALLEHHCETMGINKERGKLVVEFRGYEVNEESVQQLAEELNSLIDEILLLRSKLPVFLGDKKVVKKYRLLKLTYYFELLLLILGMFIGAVVVGFDMFPVDDRPVLLLVFGGLGAGVFFIPIAWLIASGHYRGAKHFRYLILLGFWAFPLGGLGLGMGTNRFLDTSNPQVHRVRAAAKGEYCSSDRHSVAVRDWRDNRRTFYVKIRNLRLCRSIKAGDTFEIVVREGFWGWPWISDFKVFK